MKIIIWALIAIAFCIVGIGILYADIEETAAPDVYRKHPPHPLFADNVILQWVGLIFATIILYLISYSIFSVRLQSALKRGEYSRLPEKMTLSSLSILFFGLAFALPAFLGNLAIYNIETIPFGRMYVAAIGSGIFLIFELGFLILGFVMIIMGRN